MNKISVEIYSHIYSFLEIKDLLPHDKYSDIILKSNLIWKPLLIKKFNVYKSINFYEEFKWQVRLKQNKEKYKQKWKDTVTKYYEEILPAKKKSEVEMEAINGDDAEPKKKGLCSIN